MHRMSRPEGWGWKRSLWHKESTWNRERNQKRWTATHRKMWKDLIHTSQPQSHSDCQATLRDFVTTHYFISSWRKMLSKSKTYWITWLLWKPPEHHCSVCPCIKYIERHSQGNLDSHTNQQILISCSVMAYIWKNSLLYEKCFFNVFRTVVSRSVHCLASNYFIKKALSIFYFHAWNESSPEIYTYP